MSKESEYYTPTLRCGCWVRESIEGGPGGPYLKHEEGHCPLHAHAGEMLKMLETILARVSLTGDAENKIMVLIAKASGVMNK